MTQRDFKIKKGLVVGGNITSNTGGFSFNYETNALSIAGQGLANQSNVDSVAANLVVYATNTTANVDSVSANLVVYATNTTANVNSVSANVEAYNIQLNANINAVQSNANSIQSNVVSTQDNVNTVSANVDSLSTSFNIYAANTTSNVNSVQDNVASATSTAAANDYTTYTTLNSRIDTVSSNTDTLSGNVTSRVNAVQDNVTAAEANISSVIDGTTPFTGTVTMEQDLVVGGNFSVGGQLTAINSTDTEITDRVITLANGAVSASFDTGLFLTRGTDGNVFVGYDESADEFVAAYTNNVASNTITDYVFTSYANFHVDNLVVEGLVDGVDITALFLGVDNTTANVNTVSSNVDTLSGNVTTRINTVQDNVATVSQDFNVYASNTTANVNAVNSNLVVYASNTTANVNTVQDNVAAIIDGSTPITGDFTVQGETSTVKAVINTQLEVGSNVITGVGSIATTVFTFPGSVYRGAELLVMVQDITNTEYQLSKILVVHDGTSVFTTEYGIIYTGTAELTSFSASIDGSDNITIVSTGGSANKKITVAAHELIQ